MFNLFKKKSKEEKIFAPVDGQFVALEEVSDPVFAQKMMGEGFGIKPEHIEVYAPVAGTVTSIFETKHALGIKTDAGLEILVHIGIDTVGMKGEPFTLFVKEGDQITPETKLANADFEQIRAAGKDDVVLTLITNSAETVESLAFNSEGSVLHSQEVGSAKIK